MSKKFWYVVGGVALGSIITYQAIRHDWAGKVSQWYHGTSKAVVQQVDNGYQAAKVVLHKDIGRLIIDFRADMKERRDEYPRYAGDIATLGIDSIAVANDNSTTVGQEAIMALFRNYATTDTRVNLAVETVVDGYKKAPTPKAESMATPTPVYHPATMQTTKALESIAK